MALTMRSAIAVLAAAALVAVLAPATALAAAAAGKTVICKDGTTDEGGRGACRGHGGVDKAATAKAQGGAEEKAAKSEPKAEKAAKARKEKADERPKPTVVCKDGTTDEGGRGACRGHGGVDKAAGAKAHGGGTAAAEEKPAKAEPKAEKAAAPAQPAAPAAATASKAGAQHEKADPAKGPPTARCKDGTLSYAEHHTGACSRHGGVEEWLDKK